MAPTRLAALLAAALPALAGGQGEADTASQLEALALAPEEREEQLALALATAMAGNCAGALARLDGLPPAEDELGRRTRLERERLSAWVGLRDAFLAELEAAQKPLSLDVAGKKVASAFRRSGDRLAFARGPLADISVEEIPPESLVAAIPKERFAGESEWLKVYPYCVTGNAKWKRLTTSHEDSAALKRDAESFYPPLAALFPAVLALDGLARRASPPDAAGARRTLAEIEALLSSAGAIECVRSRRSRFSALAQRLLAQVADSMDVPELTHATVSTPAEGTWRLAYGEGTPEGEADWVPADGTLDGLRTQLDPVGAGVEDGRFCPRAGTFSGNGESCWRHVLEFVAPLRIQYTIRWDPIEAQPNKVFSFALGALADERQRHVRVNELGFLYVDEQDGPYTAVRPKGDATIQLGKAYPVVLACDGKKVEVWVDGVLRSEAPTGALTQGGVFLWVHSDLRIQVTELALEGRVAPASVAGLRAAWARDSLAALGLGPER